MKKILYLLMATAVTMTAHATDYTDQLLVLVNGEGSNTGYLFATAGGETRQAVVRQSCAGSTFDAERDKMSANASYALLSVEATVGKDGLLTFGIAEPTNGTTWLVFDNFRRTYEGALPDAISATADGSASMADAVYDVSGRLLQRTSQNTPRTLRKGIYIINHRKVIVR